MYPKNLLILLFAVVSSAIAKDRVVLARFEEVAEGGAIRQSPLEKKVVTFYYTPEENRPSVAVEIETQRGSQKQSRQLIFYTAARLLDSFEEVEVPKHDYQKHLDELRKKDLSPRRGMVMAMGSPGPTFRMMLHAKSGDVAFEVSDPEYCMYIYSEDPFMRAITRLVDACIIAGGGANAVFLK